LDNIFCNDCGARLDEPRRCFPTSGPSAPPAAPRAGGSSKQFQLARQSKPIWPCPSPHGRAGPDEAGEEIATAANYDPVEALAAVAEYILPGHPG
jgi:hypothetical protein